MFNILKEIVNYSKAANLEEVKITGTAKETVLDGVAPDRSVIFQARFHNPVPEFIDTVVGLPNLGRLNVILNIQEYQKDSKITTLMDKQNRVDAIRFSNNAGDFTNTYRLMSPELINAKITSLNFHAPDWKLEFEPSALSIQKFNFQTQAMSDTPNCETYTQDQHLMIEMGDASSIQGNFIFQPNVLCKLNRQTWAVKPLVNSLNQVGIKKISINDTASAMQISIDSGQGVFNYILMSQVK
jgi:hypothetical protein